MSEATQTEEHRMHTYSDTTDASGNRLVVQVDDRVAAAIGMSDEITDSSQTVAAGQLRAIIERIEVLETDKALTSGLIKDVYAEAKGAGFQTPAIREIVKLRKKDAAEREEAQSILDLYMQSIGMA